MVVSVERFKKVTKMSAKLHTIDVSIARSLSASFQIFLYFRYLSHQFLRLTYIVAIIKTTKTGMPSTMSGDVSSRAPLSMLQLYLASRFSDIILNTFTLKSFGLLFDRSFDAKTSFLTDGECVLCSRHKRDTCFVYDPRRLRASCGSEIDTEPLGGR